MVFFFFFLPFIKQYKTSWLSLSFVFIFVFVFEPKDLACICWSWSVSEDLAGEGSLLQITDTNLVATKSFSLQKNFLLMLRIFCGNAGVSWKLLLLLVRPNFMKFIANFVDTFKHVSILLNSCPGKLSTRNPKLLFLFWSCRQSRHLPRWHLSCFCRSLRSPHFHKILNRKNRTLAVFLNRDAGVYWPG